MVDRKVVLWMTGFGGLLLVGGQALTTFRPPRTAVIDISHVYEAYDKKKARQAQFETDIKAVQEKLKALGYVE